MLLDRNISTDGKGKYALIKLREIPGTPRTPEELAAAILAHPECVDWGGKGSDSEFFLLRLKDKWSPAALRAYHEAAVAEDMDWAFQVLALAHRAETHPGRKAPD
jgi:hypothetical protein